MVSNPDIGDIQKFPVQTPPPKLFTIPSSNVCLLQIVAIQLQKLQFKNTTTNGQPLSNLKSYCLPLNTPPIGNFYHVR